MHYNADGTIAAFEPKPGTGAPAVVKKAAVKTTEAVDPPVTSIFTPDTEFGSRFLVEVVRGCANLCRFCWAGYNYLPVRAFPADRILELARRARGHATRAGLVSIALCDHPEIERILAEADDAAARRVLELVGLPADRAEHRAVIRAYGGLVKAAMREWVRDGSLERADVRRLLARVLETIVRDVLPGSS